MAPPMLLLLRSLAQKTKEKKKKNYGKIISYLEIGRVRKQIISHTVLRWR